MLKRFFHAIIIMIAVSSFASSCAKNISPITISATTPKWKVSEYYANRCETVGKRSQKLQYAEEGIKYGEECIKEEPENAACYYYHAVNTGLYYQSKVIGYQKGLRTMIADANKVIELDPSFAYAGGYRILGQIYTEVPASSLKKDSVTMDIERSLDNLERAISLSPDFPENYIAIAKTYLELGKPEKALEAINNARRLMPAWRNTYDYMEWRKTIGKLLEKVGKKLD